MNEGSKIGILTGDKVNVWPKSLLLGLCLSIKKFRFMRLLGAVIRENAHVEPTTMIMR